MWKCQATTSVMLLLLMMMMMVIVGCDARLAAKVTVNKQHKRLTF
jgi:hypothetical protein